MVNLPSHSAGIRAMIGAGPGKTFDDPIKGKLKV
jgi:hypothetical protein